MRKTTSVFCATLLAFAVAAIFSAPAQAQYTPADVETAVGGGTYLDLTNDGAGDTNSGITMIWSNYDPTPDGNGDVPWNFPDGSDSSEFVNGNSGDDKSGVLGNSPGYTPEIQLDVSGLLASTEYTVYLAARYHVEGNDEGGDISWGTTSGSLSLLQFNSSNLPAGSVDMDPGDSADLALLNVGTLFSDGSGNLTLFVGNGLVFHQDLPDPPTDPQSIGRDRTQFDGIHLAVVPEPMTMSLMGLGGLFLARRRRVA